SSLAYDRNVKRSLYARHGIPEFWIVNLVAGEVEVCRGPEGEQYTSILRIGREGMLELQLLPGAMPGACAAQSHQLPSQRSRL
ncbi:MAG TPA: Uma2 family endonuclease, partial [Acetobacteraceae bacterium]|nr:Uma2 family endonuclease [Acetobacteraceae bacterium]